MEIEEALRKGLASSPKYLPVWYRYDKQGSVFNDRCLTENPHYYLHYAEIFLLRNYIRDMLDQVCRPCVLIHSGSGNSEKTRFFIDAILEHQDKLLYVPVDISEEFLQEVCESLGKDYGNKMDIRPIAGDYNRGIEALKHMEGNKLILWLGFVQQEPYKLQVNRVKSLSKSMSEDDALLFSLDITQDTEEVENAYLDKEGISAPLYLNALWRLNRDYGSSIDTNKFELEGKFVRNTEANTTSYMQMRVKAIDGLSCQIPGLGLSLSMKKGEYLNLFEGDGMSCKYTLQQIHALLRSGDLTLCKVWEDPNHHVVIGCARKQQ